MAIADGTHLEIHGNEVCIVRTQIQRRVKTDEFISKMGELNPVCSGLQPRECIYYQQWTRGNAPHSLYVVEWSPRRVSLNYRTAWTSIRTIVHEVFFPWTQWYLHVISGKVMRVHITCTSHRIKQMDDKLFVMPLPNQDTGGFCQGAVNCKPELPVQQQCEQIITDLVTSIWNDDLSPRWRDYGLEDDEALEKANLEYQKVRSAWQKEHDEINNKRCAAETEEEVNKYKKELHEHAKKWNKLEVPIAQKFLAAVGLGRWAQLYKEKGEECWMSLVKVEHHAGDFKSFVKQLVGDGGG